MISTGCSAAAYSRAYNYLTCKKTRGFSVYFPIEQVIIVHAGRKQLEARPFIPGYAFVEKDKRDPAMIRNCPGVNSIVYGQSSWRQSLHVDWIVDRLREREKQGFIGGAVDLIRAQSYAPGETVRVIDGPFASFNGIFQCETGKQRADVLVSIFGRDSKVELGLNQLESV